VGVDVERDGHGGGVERERAAPGAGLRLGDDDLVVDEHAGHPRVDPRGGQVEIDHAQAGDLAAAHPGGGEQHPRGVQAVGADVPDERPKLGRRPDAPLRALAGGRAGGVGTMCASTWMR
jgi:hypothetical protein